MPNYTKIFAAVVISGSSIAMVAASPPADSYGDGVVSRVEYNAAAERLVTARSQSAAPSVDFASVDTNGDSRLSEGERQVMIETVQKNSRMQIDPDLTDARKRQLGGIDVNEDGQISQAEFIALNDESLPTRERLEKRIHQQMRKDSAKPL